MPTGITIGPLHIRFYGIIIMLGVLAAAFLTERLARRKGLSSDIVWDGLIWVLVGGIVGARVWHILTPPPSMVEQGLTTIHYLTHPLDAIAIWNGGLGIPGAVIGGGIAMYLYCRRKGFNLLMWLDLVAPGLALAQAIGRWGNFFNQELYGEPTDLPWAISIDPQHRLAEYRNVETYHPLFLYESLFSFANVIILLLVGRKFSDRLYDGDLFLIYLILYPVERFILEFIRLDPSQVAGFNANQTLMAVVALAAIVALVWRHWRGRKTA
jgi:phosphatidylglycerol:prolipoprotein diacylglycerol transferase